MMPIAIGLGILGLFLARRHRHHHHHACGMARGHGHPWDGHADYDHDGWGERGGRWGRHRGLAARRMGRRFMLRRLFRELDASPAQERAIVAELEQLEQRVRASAELARDGKRELAQLMTAPALDDDGLKALTSRLDTAAAEVRDAGLAALRAVHGLLDDKQRQRLAELLERRPWWRGAGPYR